MRYGLLGRLEVVGEDGRAIAFAGDKERIVLAVLLLGANRVVSAARLIDALWGENPPPTATNALQAHVSRLRKKLARGTDSGEVLRREPSGYLLRVAPGELDVERFEELLGAGVGPAAEVSDRLGEALSLWRGPALADAHSDALTGEAARLDELRQVALERRVEADLALGRHREVVPDLEAVVADQPLREGPRRQLMLALYRSGRQADALHVYRQTRDILADELGLDPSPALRALELAILNQSSELDAPVEPGPVGLTAARPSGTVTFVFTDIEGSTRLVRELGSEVYAQVLLDHRDRIRGVVTAHRGFEVGTEGDGFFIAFERASDALHAVEAVQMALAGSSVRVRVGVHTGEPLVVEGDYIGLDVHRAARICAAAHGGQVLVSEATRAASGDPDHHISFTDLGLHQLKDLDAPVRLYQVGAPGLEANFPPVRTLTAETNNFPLQLTSFIGREDDIAAVRKALEAGRLVTLVGAGGIGKTRLALEVAAECVDEFPDGAWLVDLAALSDPHLVPTTTAAALSVREQPFRPILDCLVDYLIPKKVLVVLDNCEHLIEVCAAMTYRLLSSCPRLKVLATSREALNVPGETTWHLRSLTVPGLDESLEVMAQAESVRLLLQRAGAARPDFELTLVNAAAVAQICRRLDGVPLAIELAAARIPALTVQEVASRLDDRFRLLTRGVRTALPRQRTLEAAVAWSYDLLPEPARLLFNRLSVFAGGFSGLSAQQVCSDERLPAVDIVDVLTQLVERSLVTTDELSPGSIRYALLETLRHFAADRLHESEGTEELRHRHLAWAVAYADASPSQNDSSQTPQTALEEDNLRAALDWAIETGDEEAALRIVGSAWFGHFDERVRLLGRLLPPSSGIAPAVTGPALFTGMAVAFMMGDWALGAERAQLAVDANRASGDKFRTSLSLCYHALCLWGLGRDLEALPLAEDALTVAQAIGSRDGEARALLALAWLWAERDVDRAQGLALRGIELATDNPDVFDLGHMREVFAFTRCLQGAFDDAALHLSGTAALFRQIQVNCRAHILETCAAWAAMTENFELGAELLGAAERIRDETGDRPRPWERSIREQWLPLIKDNLDHEVFETAKRKGASRSVEEALTFAERALNN